MHKNISSISIFLIAIIISIKSTSQNLKLSYSGTYIQNNGDDYKSKLVNNGIFLAHNFKVTTLEFGIYYSSGTLEKSALKNGSICNIEASNYSAGYTDDFSVMSCNHLYSSYSLGIGYSYNFWRYNHKKKNNRSMLSFGILLSPTRLKETYTNKYTEEFRIFYSLKEEGLSGKIDWFTLRISPKIAYTYMHNKKFEFTIEALYSAYKGFDLNAKSRTAIDPKSPFGSVKFEPRVTVGYWLKYIK